MDLSPASLYQAQVASGLAEALTLPLILVHVIEPLKTRLAARLHLTGVEADRRAVAEEGLGEIVATMPPRLHPEALVAYGDPAEELAKVVRDRQAGLVVMGLHGSPLLGPRMGSVTYRLLCLAPRITSHRRGIVRVPALFQARRSSHLWWEMLDAMTDAPADSNISGRRTPSEQNSGAHGLQ